MTNPVHPDQPERVKNQAEISHITATRQGSLHDTDQHYTPSEDEVQRENIAFTLNKQGAFCGLCDYENALYPPDAGGVVEWRCSDCERCLHRYADALLPLIASVRRDAQAERIVTTAEELDALPIDTVVVDFAGVPRTKRAGNSHMSGGWTHGGNSPLTSKELADGHPMAVIYEGRSFPPSTPNQTGSEQ